MTGTKRRGVRQGSTRRSDEQRIAELEARIAAIRAQEEERQRRDDPLLKDVPKVQSRLKKFGELAAERGRLDIANSVTAWISSLDRMLRDDRLRPAKLVDDEDDAAGE